ncbi:MAG: DUF4843 domain-containing protein [Prevotella sp.]|jgi:hypothetical protein|nr:DUF4843 domain-containing protein [Prevotella sp.]
MKKIISAIFVIALAVTSCNYDDLPTYKDVDRIYFEYASLDILELIDRKINVLNPDRMKIDFGFDKQMKTDSVIRIGVKIMGNPAPFDRAVTVTLIPGESSAVEGTDVVFMPSVIPANATTGTLYVKLLNTERIKTATILARLRLTPNEYFHVDYTQTQTGSNLSGIEYNIYFDAKSGIPRLWADENSSRVLKQYFGEFGKTKLEVICVALGLTEDYFDATEEDLDMDRDGVPDRTYMNIVLERFPSELSYGYIIMVNQYIASWEQQHKKSLLDENGKKLSDTLPNSTWF